MRSRRAKAKPVKAYAVAQNDAIDIMSLEEFGPVGRDQIVRNLNRPAGQRLIIVTVMEMTRRKGE